MPDLLRRIGVVAGLTAALLACSDSNGPQSPRLLVAPVLDSIFVDDSLTPRAVQYYDDHGAVQPPGTVMWSSSEPAVLAVNSVTGAARGVAAGFATLLASARGIEGAALVVVSRPLQLTLLLDSLYLMAGDTLTLPLSVAHRTSGTPAVWFSAAANAVFALDSASGRATATAPGGPVRFVAHAALGADTTADSGTVEVLSLSDTTGGRAGYTMFGTVIRSVRVAAQSTNYRRNGDTLTFRFRGFITQGTSTVEAVVITARAPVTVPDSFTIDSLSPLEAFAGDPVCRPARNWGSWSTLATDPRVDALSRRAGRITITQVTPVPNGSAISGRFYFLAQRIDMYGDPLGVLPIRGTFVVPLVATTNRCSP